MPPGVGQAINIYLSVKLTIRVQNVPALSGGVSCVFENLSESSGEVLEKGQVICMSPSLKELPTPANTHGRSTQTRVTFFFSPPLGLFC